MFCKNCGKEIDDKAVVCPNCGVATSEKKKKKKHPILGAIILIFGILLIVGAVSGGGDKPEKVVEASVNISTSPATTEKTEFTVGDKVELNDIVVTLVDVSENTGTAYTKPSDGKVFVLCEFEIENNSGKDIAVSSIMCFEAYFDDYATSMNLSALLNTDKAQLDGSVAAGKKMNGVIGYEVDSGWSELEIRFTPNFWSGKDIIFTYAK